MIFIKLEPFCPDLHPDWRKEQEIEGVTIEESLVCYPDNPWAIAAFVKGTNNVSMDTLMKSGLATDTVVMGEDKDGDGDPDVMTYQAGSCRTQRSLARYA